MSISTADTETEQNGRPRICSPTGRFVSDTREQPKTEVGESDELSSSGIHNCNRDSQYNECMDFISDVNRRRPNCRGRMTEHSQIIYISIWKQGPLRFLGQSYKHKLEM